MKNRFLSLLLVLLTVLSLLTINAAAAENDQTPAAGTGGTYLEDWNYDLDEEAHIVNLTKYIGEADVVEVPGSFEIQEESYDTVIAAETVFRGNTEIQSVTLSSAVSFADGSMRLLFGECSSLTSADFSAIDASCVTNMSYLFYKCSALKSFVFPQLDTSQVTTVRSMFSGCEALTSLNVSAIDTSNVTDMSFMFYNCAKLKKLDVSSFDTSHVTSIRSMFSCCNRLSGLTGYENWDTSSVESMYQTFNKVAYSLSASTQVCIDLSRWDMSHVTNTGWCFQMCRAQQIIVPDNIAVMSAGFMNHAIRFAGSSYTIPASVQKIGYAHTFYDFATDDFTEFSVAEGNTAYQAIDGVLYSADGKEMLAVPRNKPFDNGVFEIPEGVDFLAELSFSRNYNIHTVVLPDSYEIEYVPVYDERYIVFEDTGNLNAGTNLSIAIYCYTGITDYAVKETNPRYTSSNGVIYSKDMTHVVAIPARYDKEIVIPEGVTDWDREAMWADGSSTVDNLLANCSGVSLPATLTVMSDDQLEMLNRLHANRADSDNPFTITLAQGSTAFHLNEEGFLIPAVSITSQPEDVAVDLNKTARTSVVAEGEELTYQWYGRDKGQTEFFKSSIKTNTYSVKLVQSKIGREVYCVITDKYGNTATTRTAVLNVAYPEDYVAPAVVTEPEDAYADIGETAYVSFTAEGDGLTYQWYGRDPGQTDFWKSSIKTDTYSVKLVKSKIGREVYCVITDKYGNTAKTRTAVINVAYPEDYAGPTIVTEPENGYADEGDTVSVSFAAEGEGLTYQWYGRDIGQTDFWKSSIKTDTYSATMNTARNGREIYCVVTDKYGNTVQTDTVTLNMNIPEGYALTVDEQPEDCAVANGKKASATFAVSGDGLSYEWYGKDPGQTDFWKSSIKKDTYSVSMVPAKSGRQIYCVVTDQYGNSVTSDTVTLSIAE